MKEIGLFDGSLGAVKTTRELLSLQESYAGVFHPSFVCLSALEALSDDRQWLEDLWLQYKGHEDKNFPSDLKKQFPQRVWEMYLGVTLLSQGFILGKASRKWPDFIACRDELVVWIEATCPTKGDKDDPNRVPDMGSSSWGVPEEKILLRVTGALREKRGFLPVGFESPYVIALNRNELQWPDLDLPYAAKALYGIGGAVINIPLGGSFEEMTESHTERPFVYKVNGAEVGTTFFFDPENAGVSAVLYCMDGILNCPRRRNEMGSNFFVFHNPLATHKIPVGYFHFAKEEWGPTDASGEYIGRVRY